MQFVSVGLCNAYPLAGYLTYMYTFYALFGSTTGQTWAAACRATDGALTKRFGADGPQLFPARLVHLDAIVYAVLNLLAGSDRISRLCTLLSVFYFASPVAETNFRRAMDSLLSTLGTIGMAVGPPLVYADQAYSIVKKQYVASY